MNKWDNYSRMDQVKSLKGCLPQILLGLFLNTLSQIMFMFIYLIWINLILFLYFYMPCFAQFCNFCTILKTRKTPKEECFSRFLNFANGTKFRKTSHILRYWIWGLWVAGFDHSVYLIQFDIASACCFLF